MKLNFINLYQHRQKKKRWYRFCIRCNEYSEMVGRCSQICEKCKKRTNGFKR